MDDDGGCFGELAAAALALVGDDGVPGLGDVCAWVVDPLMLYDSTTRMRIHPCGGGMYRSKDDATTKGLVGREAVGVAGRTPGAVEVR